MTSARDARIAEACISGSLIRDIATENGVSERQVFRVLAKPEVREILDAAARSHVRAATIALQKGARASAAALLEIVENRALPAAARVSAAALILGTATKGIELDDLERRLTQLEEAEEKPTPPFGMRRFSS